MTNTDILKGAKTQQPIPPNRPTAHQKSTAPRQTTIAPNGGAVNGYRSGAVEAARECNAFLKGYSDYRNHFFQEFETARGNAHTDYQQADIEIEAEVMPTLPNLHGFFGICSDKSLPAS